MEKRGPQDPSLARSSWLLETVVKISPRLVGWMAAEGVALVVAAQGDVQTGPGQASKAVLSRAETGL